MSIPVWLRLYIGWSGDMPMGPPCVAGPARKAPKSAEALGISASNGKRRHARAFRCGLRVGTGSPAPGRYAVLGFHACGNSRMDARQSVFFGATLECVDQGANRRPRQCRLIVWLSLGCRSSRPRRTSRHIAKNRATPLRSRAVITYELFHLLSSALRRLGCFGAVNSTCEVRHGHWRQRPVHRPVSEKEILNEIRDSQFLAFGS